LSLKLWISGARAPRGGSPAPASMVRNLCNVEGPLVEPHALLRKKIAPGESSRITNPMSAKTGGQRQEQWRRQADVERRFASNSHPSTVRGRR